MKLITGLVTGLLLVGIVTTSHAFTIDSETILTNPASTENLWAYSYLSSNPAITSSAYYTANSDEFSSAVFEGYLTGVNDIRPTVDHFQSWSNASRTTRVFTTYIMSSVDQTVRFGMGGDDGHSIFVDDGFLVGGGFGVNISTEFNMVANQSYKLTSVGNNLGGHFELLFSMSGDLGSENQWGGHVSEAQNISMDATGNFAPVPEPATILLLGSGLVGLAGAGRKKFLKK